MQDLYNLRGRRSRIRDCEQLVFKIVCWDNNKFRRRWLSEDSGDGLAKYRGEPTRVIRSHERAKIFARERNIQSSYRVSMRIMDITPTNTMNSKSQPAQYVHSPLTPTVKQSDPSCKRLVARSLTARSKKIKWLYHAIPPSQSHSHPHPQDGTHTRTSL